jgi:23S rRNA (uridine2552-2'-O)-methyltransferase
VKLAQKEGYRARAAYKLKELDDSLGLVKPGGRVGLVRLPANELAN